MTCANCEKLSADIEYLTAEKARWQSDCLKQMNRATQAEAALAKSQERERGLLRKAVAVAEHWTPPVGGFEGYSSETAHRVCREIAERIEALSEQAAQESSNA